MFISRVLQWNNQLRFVKLSIVGAGRLIFWYLTHFQTVAINANHL